MSKKWLPIFVPAIILAGSLALNAQTPERSVLDGVFTAAQGTRGHTNYIEHCEKCHGGSEPDASPIIGDEFIGRWREDSLVPLLSFIRTKMPGDEPGKFSEDFYVDVLSYLLEASGYQPGSTELTAADAKGILLVGRDGPKPLPNQALVAAVGCLTPAAGGWNLTNVGTLSRTKEGDNATPEELKAGEAKAMGSQSFTLRNLDVVDKFNPDEHKGHKVLTKGVYSVQSAGARISVTFVQMVASACP